MFAIYLVYCIIKNGFRLDSLINRSETSQGFASDRSAPTERVANLEAWPPICFCLI